MKQSVVWSAEPTTSGWTSRLATACRELGSGGLSGRSLIGGALPVIAISCLLWQSSLSRIDVRDITDIGLVPALPTRFLVALGLLSLSYCVVVHQREAPPPLLLLHVIVLIVIFHATLAVVYETPRYPWTYKHVGVVDYIQRKGSVDPFIDAYHNWPGFFALVALFNEIAGFSTSLSTAAWAQLFYNLLYIAPLLLLYRSQTADQRLRWLGVWLFYLAHWVGQDYFAPQPMSFFFYIIIVGVCLTWFRVTSPLPESTIRRLVVFAPLASLLHRVARQVAQKRTQDAIARPAQYVGLMALVILLFLVIAFSHQLTPFMIVFVFTFLVIFQCCRARGLPVLMGVATVTWVVYPAIIFLAMNSAWIPQSIGRLFDNLDKNVVDLSESSPGRVLVARMCRGLTLGIWGMAFFGAIRRLRKGFWDLPIGLVAVGAFPMLGMQAYGGEMLFRVYLLSLPAMAFLAAALLYPSPTSSSRWSTLVLTLLVSGAAIGSFCFAYYGNERVNRVTQDEVDAFRHLYETAPHGSLVLTVTFDAPNRFQDCEHFPHGCVEKLVGLEGRSFDEYDMELLLSTMGDKKFPAAYLVISRSQQEMVDLEKGLPEGEIAALLKTFGESPHFREVFVSADARIFALSHSGDAVGQ